MEIEGAEAFDEDTLLNLAHQNYKAGNYKQALEHSKAVYERNPGRTDNLLLFGALYYQLHDFDMCITKNEESLRIDPHFAECYGNMVNAWKEKGNIDVTIRYYLIAIEIRPNFADAWSNLASAYMRKGRLNEAAQCCRQALALNTCLVDAHSNLDNLMKAQGLVQETYNCYVEALRIQPAFSIAWSNLAGLFMEAGDLNRALQYYKEAVKLKPNFSYAYLNLGNVYKALGMPQEAIVCCQHALQVRPDYAMAFDNLASAAARVGVVNCGIKNDCDPALALLAEYVDKDDPLVRISAIIGLGLAYASAQNEQIISNHICIDGVKRVRIGELIACLLPLGLGLLYLGKQESVDATAEVSKTFHEKIRKHCDMTLHSCAYVGTGNVLKVQQSLGQCAQHLEKGETYQGPAILGIAMVAMSEELGLEMTIRSLEHLLQYGEQNIRRAVPLALGLLCISNPKPRMLMTMDENLKSLYVPVRVGQAVDVIGQAGRPKTITDDVKESARFRCANAATKRKNREEDPLGVDDAMGYRGVKVATKAVEVSDSVEQEPCKTFSASNSKVLKILTYNVWFADIEMPKRMKALGGLIAMHSPDVICFQEVTPEIYDIFQHTGWWKMYSCSVSNVMELTRGYFCMQLSKLAVKSYSCKPFSNSAMGSHLESPCPGPPKWNQMYSKERVEQAKEAVDLLDRKRNVIFCGDMNWDDKLDGQFRLPDGWIDAWGKMKPKEIGWTYDTKSNKMLSANRTLQKRLDRFVCKLQDFCVK
ncbi:hypothetical protein K7X08_017304 [Anisodus acutangulus]|uniref:Endonuclease/exonuclease/phosphatase domain-containing protein n=1 Tax=Anisodus acutangulus TaxID=402998 RepID=A0A9Q1LVR0_9SOLA|nr:hypothetical protein K7X08_017304 [Anisodus acutangulus]